MFKMELFTKYLIEPLIHKVCPILRNKWTHLCRPARVAVAIIGILILAAIGVFLVYDAHYYPKITSVSLSQQELSLTIGETVLLDATVLYSNNNTSHDVVWVSSNEAVIQVDSSGQLIAEGTGTAVITAQAANRKTTGQASCSVTVTAGLTGYSISVERTVLDNFVYIRVQPNEDTVTEIQIYAKSPSGQLFQPALDPENLYHFYSQIGDWTVYAVLTGPDSIYKPQRLEDYVTFDIQDISATVLDAYRAGLPVLRK